MTKYQSTRAINFDGNIVEAGKVLQFEEKDADFVQRLLDKGSIVEVSEEVETVEETVVTPTEPVKVETSVTPEVPTPPAPTVPNGQPSAEQIEQDLKAAGV